MEETKHIQIKDFNYELPEERIAKFPLPERDQSKLLVYRHGTVGEDTFTSLPDYLPQGALWYSTTQKSYRRGCISTKIPARSSRCSVWNRSVRTTTR